jgi:signal transduction histidine kinase/CheY-like chemotaxis protein
MSEYSGEIEQLKKEINYYKKKLDELAGENLRYDYVTSGLRHELKQKKEGFALLSKLQQSIGLNDQVDAIFQTAINAINSTVGMDKSIVLVSTEQQGVFSPTHALGPNLDIENLKKLKFEIPESLARGHEFIICNKDSIKNDFTKLISESFDLPYFIISAVTMGDVTLAIFVSGRLREAKPLYPPIDKGDADTFLALGGLISSVVEAMKVASLRETDRLKTEFFANISHEFRTPITLTIGPIESLIKGHYGEINEKIKNVAENILKNQHRLLGLINQILDLAKMESGEMKLRVNKISKFNSLIKQISEQFQALAVKRGLELKTDLDNELDGAEIFIDIEKFDKAIFNLLSNALKFTKIGSVTIKTEKIENFFEVSVIDTGMGIRSDQISTIFDRFKQADGSESREFSGTGIGLSLVKEIAEIHNGNISVRSEYGKGTTFILTLPLGKSHFSSDVKIIDDDFEMDSIHKATMSLTQTVTETEGKATLEEIDKVEKINKFSSELSLKIKKSKILYVDDNQELRNFVFDLLKEEYLVFLAVNGEDGYEKAKEYNVDLIISDLMMPVLTGTQLLKKLKSNNSLSQIPFIMLTAKSGMQTKLEGLEGGVEDFLTKPFSEEELKARVKNLIKIREQQRRIKKDLEAAKLIQQSLLPERKQVLNNFSIEVYYRPCDDLSGDFFEIKTINDFLFFYVADVTSHGTASAQVTYLLKGIFNKLATTVNEKMEVDDLTFKIAEEFCAYKLIYSVCLCLGKLNTKTGYLEYVNSGVPAPILVKESEVAFLDSQTNPIIDSNVFQASKKFLKNNFLLDKGESVYFFTDGTIEFKNTISKREFGARRFGKLLLKNNSIKNWSEGLMIDLEKANESDQFDDDLTVLRLSHISI